MDEFGQNKKGFSLGSTDKERRNNVIIIMLSVLLIVVVVIFVMQHNENKKIEFRKGINSDRTEYLND